MVWMPKYTITQSILAGLAQIENVKNAFEDKPLSPVLLASLHKSAKVAAVHFSTQIEGNNMSFEQVENALYTNNQAVRSYRGHDEQEVKAYYNAVNYMEKYLAENQLFSEAFIKKIHSLIEGEKTADNYRQMQNAIYNSSDGALVYLPPEAKDVPQMMKDLTLWVNDNVKKLPVPVIAGLFHYQFVTIHPYIDGNGRTARLITAYIMRKFGYGLKGIYSLEEYYAKNLRDYYEALAVHPHHNYYYGRADADLTPWLAYFIKGAAEAFTNISSKAVNEHNIGFATDKTYILRELDVKQRTILELFTEYKEITSAQAGEYLEISSQSAGLMLNKWVKEGFLQIANSAKKNRTYALADKYEDLITA